MSVMCERGADPDPDHSGFFTTEEGGTTFRAPKRGRRLRTGDLTRGMDLCRVWLEPRTVTRHGARRHYGRKSSWRFRSLSEGPFGSMSARTLRRSWG